MNEQLVLFAMMQIHSSNFHILHWKAAGSNFNDSHNDITNEYYEKVTADIDDVAEIMMRQNINPLNYKEVKDYLSEHDVKVMLFPSNKDYNRDEIVHATDYMLGEIVSQIIKVLQSEDIQDKPQNIGVKSFYESLLDGYDKEYRFLNKRRMVRK